MYLEVRYQRLSAGVRAELRTLRQLALEKCGSSYTEFPPPLFFWRDNSPAIKFTVLKHLIQWFLVQSQVIQLSPLSHSRTFSIPQKTPTNQQSLPIPHYLLPTFGKNLCTFCLCGCAFSEHIRWDHATGTCVSGFFYLACCQSSSVLWQVSICHSVLLLNHIPLRGYAVFYLSTIS